MSKKQATAPAECLKMNIELADNGIIIRNPDEEDEVTLALHRDDSDRARDVVTKEPSLCECIWLHQEAHRSDNKK